MTAAQNRGYQTQMAMATGDNPVFVRVEPGECATPRGWEKVRTPDSTLEGAREAGGQNFAQEESCETYPAQGRWDGKCCCVRCLRERLKYPRLANVGANRAYDNRKCGGV
jgi:hypothetical protein